MRWVTPVLNPEAVLADGTASWHDETIVKALGLFRYGGLSEKSARGLSDLVMSLPEQRHTVKLMDDFLAHAMPNAG